MPVVWSINGMPGVGKTALALRAGHLLASRFPDGQFFLDLHAHTAGRQPIEPMDAIGSLLAADGVSPPFLPPVLDDRVALWRSRTADRRVLLILDNAVDHTQVEPLLPATGRCQILVTSRRRLSALAAESIELNPLSDDDAARMFPGS